MVLFVLDLLVVVYVNQLLLHLGLHIKECYNIFLLFLYSKQEQEGYFEAKNNKKDCWDQYMEGINNVFLFFLYSKQEQEEHSEVKGKDDNDDN